MTEPETLVQPTPVYFYEISSENASPVRVNPLKLISGVNKNIKNFLRVHAKIVIIGCWC
jgi:hypothetical protein